MSLDPTYKFFTDAGIAIVALFVLFMLLGGTLFLMWRWLKSSDEARKGKEKADEAQAQLELTRLKMMGELSSQITEMNKRISDDREHDRQIREKELEAVNKLVKASDDTTAIIQTHVSEAVVFRTTMTDTQAILQREVATANEGINGVKAGLSDLETALRELPNAIQSILSPYCERIESALQKLETERVEEKHNDRASVQPLLEVGVDSGGHPDLAVASSNPTVHGLRTGNDGNPNASDPHAGSGDGG